MCCFWRDIHVEAKMANAAGSDGREQRRRKSELKRLRRKLEDLDCPFVEEADDEWIKGLLFEPSEARIRLMTWLISRFDPKFEEVLHGQIPSASNKIDSRIQRLLFLGNLTGLCNADDIELIKGTTSQKKQIQFWENLLDLVITSETAASFARPTNDSQDDSVIIQTGSPFRAKQKASFAETYDHNCRYMDILSREEKVGDLFSGNVQLFPPDLERLFDTESDRLRAPLPDIQALSELTEKLSVDVDMAQRQLEELKARFLYEELDQENVDRHCKRMTLALTMFSQLINNFIHCYENEIRHWCNRPKPRLSDIGPAGKFVYDMAQKHGELLQSIDTLRECHNDVTVKLIKEIKKEKPKGQGVNHEDLKELRDMIEILETSMQRLTEEKSSSSERTS